MSLHIFSPYFHLTSPYFHFTLLDSIMAKEEGRGAYERFPHSVFQMYNSRGTYVHVIALSIFLFLTLTLTLSLFLFLSVPLLHNLHFSFFLFLIVSFSLPRYLFLSVPLPLQHTLSLFIYIYVFPPLSHLTSRLSFILPSTLSVYPCSSLPCMFDDLWKPWNASKETYAVSSLVRVQEY